MIPTNTLFSSAIDVPTPILFTARVNMVGCDHGFPTPDFYLLAFVLLTHPFGWRLLLRLRKQLKDGCFLHLR